MRRSPSLFEHQIGFAECIQVLHHAEPGKVWNLLDDLGRLSWPVSQQIEDRPTLTAAFKDKELRPSLMPMNQPARILSCGRQDSTDLLAA